MSYPTIPVLYDLALNRPVVSLDGQWVTSQFQIVRASTPVFAFQFCAGAIGSKAVVNLGTITSSIFTVKSLNNFGGANLIRSTIAPTITGTTPNLTYSFSPNCAGLALADAFIVLDASVEAIADDGQLPTLPPTQAARYALTDLPLGYIVRQVDTGTYWIVIDRLNLANSAGWSTEVEQLPYIDCALQIDFTVAGETDKTLRIGLRINNDYAQNPVATTPANSFPVLTDASDVLTQPTAAEFYAANPPGAAGGVIYAGNYFRIIGIANGGKIQVSTDGVVWQDGPSYEAS